MPQKTTPLYAETLILLKLWELAQADVTKSSFMPGSTPAYQQALTRLEAEAALSSKAKTSRSKVYSLTDQGKARLAQAMANPEFVFTTNLGAKTANSVLKWFRLNSQVAAAPTPSAAAPLTSYQEFLEETLQIYEDLNRDYNLGDLVPIYRIRRHLGDRISRSQFTEWLLEMQANDLVQLMGGQVPNVTQDQREDSVTIPGGGLRFYVKRL
jgi:DNA-binding PadR family transcriptional regulator